MNGILPAGGGPLHIYVVSLLIRLRSALGGIGILRSTALRSFLAAAVNLLKLLGLCWESSGDVLFAGQAMDRGARGSAKELAAGAARSSA
jgi:hypothetical protein